MPLFGSRPNPVLLAKGSVAAAATLDILINAFGAYRALKFLLTNLQPANGLTALWSRISNDGGATFITLVNYASSGFWVSETGVYTGFGIAADGKMIFTPATLSNGANNAGHLELLLWNHTDATRRPKLICKGVFLDSATNAMVHLHSAGSYKVATQVDAIRFLASAGNLTSDYAVFGLP